MRILLDTHVLLWTLAGSRRLSPESVAAIREADDLFVSSVSFAEIGVKAAVGKLEMPDELRENRGRDGRTNSRIGSRPRARGRTVACSPPRPV
jgi:PIN domain nuclease of toxin-antitoxin system